MILASLLLLSAAPGNAQKGGSGSASDTPLPVQEVVLFSSGVGYFQHSGEISGPTTLDFSFQTAQINDLLKSLVLLDPAGQVKPVTYTAQDPISRGLAGLGLNIQGTFSMGNLLRQLQGVRVQVVVEGRTLEGVVVSVSVQEQEVKEKVIRVEVLNLLTDSGLTAIPMNDILRVQILDPALQERLQDALSLLATGLDNQRKTVSVHFGGDQRREVTLGYLLEAPIWKTSYRLVLNDEQPHYLQGWAIVENTTDRDWNEISLSLVSGRPVSFIQNLYTPLYLPRPVVQPPVEGSATPQTYASDVIEGDDASELLTQLERSEMAAPPAGIVPELVPMRGLDALSSYGAIGEERLEPRSNLRKMAIMDSSITAQAQGEERGELFEYAISQPVTIPSQQAAMVPIISSGIQGTKVSIFTPGVNYLHPMHGVRLENNTGMHLKGGPITVYSDNIYAGDAQIENLQPGEDRLISYAADLGVESKYETSGRPQELVSMRADSGLLYIIHKSQIEHNYTFRNTDDQPREMVVQQPIQPGWNLVKPAKPDSETVSHYRFHLKVPAGETGTFQVVIEQPRTESVLLIDADLNFLMSHAQNAQLSQKMRAALQELVRLRRAVTDIQSQQQATQNEINAITAEQERIRKNMEQLDRASDLYQRYVATFSEQEDRVVALRQEQKRLQSEEQKARDALRSYIDSLKID